jgi:type I restriction enzyme S subunit
VTDAWQEVSVEDLAAPAPNAMSTGPFGSAISSRFFRSSGVPVIRGSNLSVDPEVRLHDDGLVFLEPAKAAEFSRSVVRRGDLVFTSWGTINQVGLIDDSAAYDEYVVSNKQMKLTPATNKAVPEFLYYLFSAPETQREILDGAIGTGVPGFNLTRLRSLKLRIPARPEQERIAAAISEADLTVRRLRQRIAKKRAVKQGMMQELLTGRTRLPGSAGDWQTHRVGDFAQVKAGGTPSTRITRYWGGDIRWMNSGEIHQKRVHEVAGRITVDGLRESAAQLLPAGTVLMALAGQGKTRGTVAVSRVELSTNQSIAGILPSERHHPDFVFYNLDARYDELRGESSGDGGRGGLNLTIIKRLSLYMPDVPEQAAIAEVLSDVDDELDALERRLAKARAVKHGMMQQLLTGQTRLPAEEAAA